MELQANQLIEDYTINHNESYYPTYITYKKITESLQQQGRLGHHSFLTFARSNFWAVVRNLSFILS